MRPSRRRIRALATGRLKALPGEEEGEPPGLGRVRENPWKNGGSAQIRWGFKPF